MTPWDHAKSSTVKWGGNPSDYIDIHNWFDETKQYTGNWTHRALRHHALGVEQAIEKFGHTIQYKNGSDVVKVPVKLIAEQHIMEDCGYIPTVQDWFNVLKQNPEDWMLKVKTKSTEEMKIID